MLRNKCETQCQHPHCWFINNKHDGFTKEPSQSKCYTSFNKTNLPNQNIINLLSDYGVYDGISEPHIHIRKLTSHSLSQGIIKSRSRYNATIVFSDESESIDASYNLHANHLNNLNTDEINFDSVNTVGVKQYVWVPNFNETRKKKYRNVRSNDNTLSSCAANLRLPVTQHVLPLEEFHSKAGKPKEKLHLPPHTRSLHRIKASHNFLEQNSLGKNKSCADFVNNEGMLPQRQLIFQIPLDHSDKSQLLLNNMHQKNLELIVNRGDSSQHRSSSLNVLECKKAQGDLTLVNDNIINNRHTSLQPITRLPSISLGLPELPSGVKITKPFTYKKMDLNFTLGPTLSALNSQRSNGSKENTTRDTNNMQQHIEITEKEALGSSQRPVSVLIPDSSLQYEFPEKRTSINKQEDFIIMNITTDNQGNVYEHTVKCHYYKDKQRFINDMETSSAFISSIPNVISPDKMFETEILTMVALRPNSVETTSTSAWPSITEALVEQNVSLTTSKTHLKSGISSKHSNEVKGEIEANFHPLEILKVEKCKVKSPAPPPPSPELQKHVVRQNISDFK